MRTRDLNIACATIVIVLLAVSVGETWVRSTPLRTWKADDVNIEKVATDYRVESLGLTSVYVPLDEGGSGQRFMADTWALYVHSPRGTNGQRAELYRAWGEDAELWLQRKRAALVAAQCSDLFGFPGYGPVEQCPR